MTFAAFIISTGRCGTQWIAHSLADVYGDVIEVEHEPLHDRYEARQHLACSRWDDATAALSPVIRDHLDAIEKCIETRPYLECGHPNWSVIPHLVRRFENRVRIIHLTRHPVTTACSWLSHQAFTPPPVPHMAEKVLLAVR